METPFRLPHVNQTGKGRGNRSVGSPCFGEQPAIFQPACARHVVSENRFGEIEIARSSPFFHRDHFHPPQGAERDVGWWPLMAAVKELNAVRRRRIRECGVDALDLEKVEIAVPGRSEPRDSFSLASCAERFRIWLSRRD